MTRGGARKRLRSFFIDGLTKVCWHCANSRSQEVLAWAVRGGEQVFRLLISLVFQRYPAPALVLELLQNGAVSDYIEHPIARFASPRSTHRDKKTSGKIGAQPAAVLP